MALAMSLGLNNLIIIGESVCGRCKLQDNDECHVFGAACYTDLMSGSTGSDL